MDRKFMIEQELDPRDYSDPVLSNNFIGIYLRTQVIVYRTGPLVYKNGLCLVLSIRVRFCIKKKNNGLNRIKM